MTYRPSGRSNRSGRSQAENDVFEGLPVKQWGQSFARVSLVPPAPEVTTALDDKWGELPLPRDCQQLSPWTQQLLRLARNGKYGAKRKHDLENANEATRDDNTTGQATILNPDDRGYLIKKWKPVPESLLEPEFKHFEFLAKRRRGMPNIYGPGGHEIVNIPSRKTRVQRIGPEGGVFVYDVLAVEGQSIEGELPGLLTPEEVAALPPSVVLGVGTVIEGLGVANEEGVVVVDALRPLGAVRRNRSSHKKKGGPGRGKKRVTFTNPDGSTYTTVVPNATKIVPQPGQTVKHVAKGEIATADISKEEAARLAAERGEGQTEGDDDDDEEGDDDDDDEDDHEDGELSDEDTSMTKPAHATTVSTHGSMTERAADTNAISQSVDAQAIPPLAEVAEESAPTAPRPVENTPRATIADIVPEDTIMEEADHAGNAVDEPSVESVNDLLTVAEPTSVQPPVINDSGIVTEETIAEPVVPTSDVAQGSTPRGSIINDAMPVTELGEGESTIALDEKVSDDTSRQGRDEIIPGALPSTEVVQPEANAVDAAMTEPAAHSVIEQVPSDELGDGERRTEEDAGATAATEVAE